MSNIINEQLTKLIKEIVEPLIEQYGTPHLAFTYTYEYGVFWGNFLYSTEIGQMLGGLSDAEYIHYYDFVDDTIDELFNFSKKVEDAEKNRPFFLTVIDDHEFDCLIKTSLQNANNALKQMGKDEFLECLDLDNSYLQAEYGIDPADIFQDDSSFWQSKDALESFSACAMSLLLDACYYLVGKPNNNLNFIDFHSVK